MPYPYISIVLYSWSSTSVSLIFANRPLILGLLSAYAFLEAYLIVFSNFLLFFFSLYLRTLASLFSIFPLCVFGCETVLSGAVCSGTKSVSIDGLYALMTKKTKDNSQSPWLIVLTSELVVHTRVVISKGTTMKPSLWHPLELTPLSSLARGGQGAARVSSYRHNWNSLMASSKRAESAWQYTVQMVDPHVSQARGPGLIKLYLVVRESESSVLTRGTELLVGNYSHVAYLPLRDSQEDKTPYGISPSKASEFQSHHQLQLLPEPQVVSKLVVQKELGIHQLNPWKVVDKLRLYGLLQVAKKESHVGMHGFGYTAMLSNANQKQEYLMWKFHQESNHYLSEPFCKNEGTIPYPVSNMTIEEKALSASSASTSFLFANRPLILGLFSAYSFLEAYLIVFSNFLPFSPLDSASELGLQVIPPLPLWAILGLKLLSHSMQQPRSRLCFIFFFLTHHHYVLCLCRLTRMVSDHGTRDWQDWNTLVASSKWICGMNLQGTKKAKGKDRTLEGLTLGEKLVVLKSCVIILWLAEFLCIGSSPQMVTLAFGIINSLRKKLKKITWQCPDFVCLHIKSVKRMWQRGWRSEEPIGIWQVASTLKIRRT
ncbi:LOW QUALITY PROTEIN: hypothetical protein HID58_039108 [Brassica napus]|uniref:Uncharacterized protein n=1 Tax=Brassica napus TaxID=3708 RepID=A0ABQ8BSY7_BRANA|nr:LOW QUALITY PROTEIN: hypothetical protein HID58_039108 [Brassica napus]